ncbi:MAG: ATP-binding protein [Desulfosporosinus sp.]|nr:ATP-binding protein [Desulfosporosinus sp.]
MLSDKLLEFLIKDSATITFVSILKGWFYVLITSLIIFLLVFTALKKVIAATGLLQKTNAILEVKIKEQHKAEYILKESESRLNMAQELTHTGNWELDITNSKVWASGEAFRIYGINQKSPYLPLDFVQSLIKKEDRGKSDSALKLLLENNEKYDIEYSLIRVDDGHESMIHSIAKVEFDENGIPQKVLGVIQDITMRKLSEKKIKQYEEETLKNKMEHEMARLQGLSLIGEVAAGIGHEIRNPMTTVRGYLQLLGSKEEFSMYNGQFSLMIDELDRANSIITEFLSLAKDRVVELKVQSLKEIVEHIFPLIQADGLISDKYIQLELDEVEEIPLDKKEIHQLILNLVLNGSQAMSPGGTMKIRTFMDKGDIVLAVQDDGKGIAPEVLEKMGTPFFTTKDNGTGLGLAVCYSIVARHNAKIDIETGLTGTTFFVRFKN